MLKAETDAQIEAHRVELEGLKTKVWTLVWTLVLRHMHHEDTLDSTLWFLCFRISFILS